MREDDTHEKGTMIFDGRYKYISRVDESHDEFYDLGKDPGERHNAIHDPEYAARIAKMQRAQLHWYQDTCDIVPLDYDARFNDKMLFNMTKSHAENADEEAFLKQTIADGVWKIPLILQALLQYRRQQEEKGN